MINMIKVIEVIDEKGNMTMVYPKDDGSNVLYDIRKWIERSNINDELKIKIGSMDKEEFDKLEEM